MAANVRIYQDVSERFQQNDFEAAVSRAEKALRGGGAAESRSASGSADEVDAAIRATLAAALVQTGRYNEALTEAQDALSDPALPATLADDLAYAHAYALYGLNRLDEAVDEVRKIRQRRANDPACIHLEAQILYRRGDYADAVALYRGQLDVGTKKRTLWTTFVSNTKAETDVQKSRPELTSNLCASLVLNGQAVEAVALGTDVDSPCPEFLYNIGCALLSLGSLDDADQTFLRSAEQTRAQIESEEVSEADVTDELAMVNTQRAFIKQIRGDIAAAEAMYTEALKSRPSAVTAAIAANNLAACRAETDNTKVFDLWRKVKTTASEDVERKLTPKQKYVFECNRLLMLVGLGNYEQASRELNAVRRIHPDDARLSMIETYLLLRSKRSKDAEGLLKSHPNDELYIAALAQVRLAEGDLRGAAAVLRALESNASAIATSAALYEAAGDFDEAEQMLAKTADRWQAEARGKHAIQALRELAAFQMRHERNESAVVTLKRLSEEVPGDERIVADLVIAASNVDESRSTELAKRLPQMPPWSTKTAEDLEAMPAPRFEARRSKRPAESRIHTADAVVQKKKKKKKRLPKNYDPSGPPPDPERWLPKSMRAANKKKRKQQGVGRGTQGADLAATAAASERMAASAATAGSNVLQTEPSAAERPKGAKMKKKRTKR